MSLRASITSKKSVRRMHNLWLKGILGCGSLWCLSWPFRFI